MEEHLIHVWIGKRESDVTTTSYFDYSITYYGSNKNKNFSFSRLYRSKNEYDDEFAFFVIHCLNEIIRCNRNTKLDVQVYTTSIAKKILKKEPNFKSYFTTQNPYSIINWMNNKIYTRLWLNSIVHIPPYEILSLSDCRLSDLQKSYYPYKEFILQKDISSGGDGTFILNEQNQSHLLEIFPNIPYMVSPYIKESMSCSCHMVIGANTIILFQPSVQTISNDDRKMIYYGTNYNLAQSALANRLEEIYSYNYKIAQKIQKIGYRGICGTDFLITDDDLLFLEINPRFQGSSFLINYYLNKNTLPDLFELNYAAFHNDELLATYKSNIESMKINASCIYNYEQDLHDTDDNEIIFNDGYKEAEVIEHNAYLNRKIIFD